MKNIKLKTIFSILFTLVILFSFTKSVQAAGPCYCEKVDKSSAECKFAGALGPCASDTTSNCSLEANAAACEVKVQAFNNAQASGAGNTQQPTQMGGGIIGAFLPKCVTEYKLDLKGDCGDITIFLVLMFNIIRYLFGIIGGVTLLYFVYGGFVFILSQGNAEKVAQGKGIIVAAVLGLIIAFGGYALVIFVGDMVGIEDQFKLNK